MSACRPTPPYPDESLRTIMASLSPEVIAAILGAVIGVLSGGLASLGVLYYSSRLERSPDLAIVAFSLASLAARLRREVLRQFAKVDDGPWVPAAIERQQTVLSELEQVLPFVQRRAPAVFVLALAAREALESSLIQLQGFWRSDRTKEVPMHLGSSLPSHHELYGAAMLLTRSHARLPDRGCV